MKNANVFLGSLDMFRFKDVPKMYENMSRRGHFVLQRVESVLKAITGDHVKEEKVVEEVQ